MDPSLLGFLGALGLIVVTLIALKLLGRRPPAELASAPVWPAPQEQTDPYPAVPAKPKAPAKRKAAARAPKPAARTAKRQRAPVFWDS
jgi:hypothetical protein